MTAPIPFTWPPNYVVEFANRVERMNAMANNPAMVIGALEYYKDPSRWVEFIEHWMITFDPRNNKNQNKPVVMPFILFPRQKDLVNFIIQNWMDGESGLLEKSRDMGATWICCAVSVCMWLFAPGSSVGWGSRKQELVDKIGDPDSIFEKIRMEIQYLPISFLPTGFDPKKHATYMKLINPVNGSTITGEVGDNIGRGGRKSIYFKDESAHYEHPELIEAALGDNTDVQIDLSSVKGTANVFARRRKSGVVWTPGAKLERGDLRVFIMDWREHPEKNQEWYDRRRKKAEREGLLHIFAQEVDRDYAAAVEGVLIPSAWVQSAVDLHKKLPSLMLKMMEGKTYSALDVADEGGDVNAQAIRKGITLFHLDKWAEGDTGQTANKAVMNCTTYKSHELHYDCIGVGAGVKSETNRLGRENKLPKYLKVVPWNAADSVLDPEAHIVEGDKDSPKNKDMFSNLKAQSGWQMRLRFEKTHKAVTQGIIYPVEELVNIQSTVPHFQELVSELSQPTYTTNGQGKLVINKKPDGTRSPNLFDATHMSFWPWKEVKQIGVWGKR